VDQFRHRAGRQFDVLGGEQRRRRIGVEAESIGPDLGPDTASSSWSSMSSVVR
jgi:hypothetical protein